MKPLFVFARTIGLLTLLGLTAVVAAEEDGTLPVLELPVPPPLEHFNAVLERPLFSADRRPGDESELRVDAASADELRAQWRLTGILLAGSDTKALLRQRNGRDHRVLAPGMLLDDDWILTEIRRDSIVLRAGDNEVQLQLREPRDTAPLQLPSDRPANGNGTGAAASQPGASQPLEVPNE